MASQRARGTHVMRTGQPAARIDTVLAVVQPPSNLKTLSFVEELVVEGMDEGPPWAPPAREPRCRDGAVPQCRECRAGMEGVGGSCRVRLKGESEWVIYAAGQSFTVPGNSSFEIACDEPYHYVCHFG